MVDTHNGGRTSAPVWNKGTPMPEDYTCHCGIYVHPTRRKPGAIHIADCPYASHNVEEVKPEDAWETRCPESLDGRHCDHWYDGDACHHCDDPAEAS